MKTATVDWLALLDGAEVPGTAVGFSSPAELVVGLEHHLRNTYPINEVPVDMVQRLNVVKSKAADLSQAVRVFAQAMAMELQQKPPERQVVHMGFGPQDKVVGTLCGGEGMISKVRDDVTCTDCLKVLRDTADRG
jgi:hypothetical protein